MSQTKTVSISGETKIEFDAVYPYVWVRNLGNSALTVWGDVGDTVSLSRLEAVRVITSTDYIYVSGTGSVEVIAQGIPDSPYKGCGGGSGGGDITVESLSVTDNGTYTAPSGKAYSPVSVDVQPTLGTKSITTNGTYTASSDNLDGYSSVTVNVSAPEYVDSNRGIVFYDDSGVSPVGFTKVDSITKSVFALSTSEQATVECCCNISLAGTYGRIWQIGTYHSVGTTLAYNNNGTKPVFEIAISDTWEHSGTFDITDYLNTTITLSLVIKDTTSELYLNGTKIEEYSIGKSTLVSDTGYLSFLHGQMSDRTTNGSLYALRVYHRALTQAEIQQNVQADIYNFGTTT